MAQALALAVPAHYPAHMYFQAPTTRHPPGQVASRGWKGQERLWRGEVSLKTKLRFCLAITEHVLSPNPSSNTHCTWPTCHSPTPCPACPTYCNPPGCEKCSVSSCLRKLQLTLGTSTTLTHSIPPSRAALNAILRTEKNPNFRTFLHPQLLRALQS